MENAQKNLKILMMVRNFDFGGAENHVCTLANELSCRGNEVWIISGGGRQIQQLHNGIHHLTKKFCDHFLIFQVLWLIRIVYREKFDVIHAHQRIMILAANLAAFFTKTPVVATVHGRIRYDLRSKFVRKFTAGIIAICENSLVGMQRDPFLAHKSVHIPNGIRFKEIAESTAKGEIRFSYISRIDQRHFEIIRFLIQEVWPSVIEKYPNARLVVAGDGPFLSQLQEMVHLSDNQLNTNSIHIEGYVNDLDQILTATNLVFGVGRVALEAIAAGVPVFSIKNKRMGEIICCNKLQHFQFGNFVDLDGHEPDAVVICRKISEFIENEQFYRSQSRQIRKHIESVYHIETVAASTELLYESMINAYLKDKINHEKVLLPTGDLMPDYVNFLSKH